MVKRDNNSNDEEEKKRTKKGPNDSNISLTF